MHILRLLRGFDSTRVFIYGVCFLLALAFLQHHLDLTAYLLIKFFVSPMRDVSVSYTFGFIWLRITLIFIWLRAYLVSRFLR